MKPYHLIAAFFMLAGIIWFSVYRDTSVLGDQTPEIRILITTGDVLLARSINVKNVRTGNFNWPFEKTADILKSADITLINLETPLLDECPPTSTGMVFCGGSHNALGLTFAGVDVVNLANNHMFNYGKNGFEATKRILSESNIQYSGYESDSVIDVRGMRFGFLGYEDFSQKPENFIKTDIEKLQQRADVIVVSFHWGVEYTHIPTKRQMYLGHLAIDSGADMVVGNHPHWIQPVEIYKHKPIIYAQGNFVFDQMWSEETRHGYIAKMTFVGKEFGDIEFIPIKIMDYGQPMVLDGEEKNMRLNLLNTLNSDFVIR